MTDLERLKESYRELVERAPNTGVSPAGTLHLLGEVLEYLEEREKLCQE